MHEAGIESVAGAHVIDHIDSWRSKTPLFISGAADGSSRSALHDHYLGQACQETDRFRKIFRPRNLPCLAFVRKEQIDMLENFLQITSPQVFRIVVRVQRSCEPGFLRLPEQMENLRSQRAVQKKRRKMQMTRLENIVHVDVGVVHLKHGPGKSQHIPMPVVRQDDSEPSGYLSRSLLHTSRIHARCG